MHIVVLGSAAGGGLPQWNCNCENCRLARSGAPNVRARSQSSLAVSRDGEAWFLLNCSPDLRQQVLCTPQLWPRDGRRHSPIGGAVLTNGDVDHVAGLLTLREGQPLVLHATARILETLAANSMFNVLSPEVVQRRRVVLGERTELLSPAGASGLFVEMFAVPGKTALYLEGENVTLGTETEDAVGLRVDADGDTFFYVPGCAELSAGLADRLDGAALVFWDGTLWRDDEMIREGVGAKTGRRMAHMSISGPDGSLAGFAALRIERKVFIHLNNTNPVLREDSAERGMVDSAGWEVAYDGMEVSL